MKAWSECRSVVVARRLRRLHPRHPRRRARIGRLPVGAAKPEPVADAVPTAAPVHRVPVPEVLRPLKATPRALRRLRRVVDEVESRIVDVRGARAHRRARREPVRHRRRVRGPIGDRDPDVRRMGSARRSRAAPPPRPLRHRVSFEPCTHRAFKMEQF